jgi:quercetin dioxygenase-like cupin family protein
MYVTSLENVSKEIPDMEGVKGVYKQIPLSKENGAPNFSFRVFTIEPGGHTPLHNHPFEHMNYVIEGKGNAIVEGDRIDIKEGDFALILPDETHQYSNTSTSGSLVIICAVPKEYE